MLSGISRKRKIRSNLYWFTEFCNSQCLSHFAAPFIVVRAETSVAESCKHAVTALVMLHWRMSFCVVRPFLSLSGRSAEHHATLGPVSGPADAAPSHPRNCAVPPTAHPAVATYYLPHHELACPATRPQIHCRTRKEHPDNHLQNTTNPPQDPIDIPHPAQPLQDPPP